MLSCVNHQLNINGVKAKINLLSISLSCRKRNGFGGHACSNREIVALKHASKAIVAAYRLATQWRHESLAAHAARLVAAAKRNQWRREAKIGWRQLKQSFNARRRLAAMLKRKRLAAKRNGWHQNTAKMAAAHAAGWRENIYNESGVMHHRRRSV